MVSLIPNNGTNPNLNILLFWILLPEWVFALHHTQWQYDFQSFDPLFYSNQSILGNDAHYNFEGHAITSNATFKLMLSCVQQCLVSWMFCLFTCDTCYCICVSWSMFYHKGGSQVYLWHHILIIVLYMSSQQVALLYNEGYCTGSNMAANPLTCDMQVLHRGSVFLVNFTLPSGFNFW